MRKGIFFLLAAALVWSWPNVMIRMLRAEFDVFTQTFFRNIAANIFLLTVGSIFARKKILEAASNWKMLLIPAMIMAANQIFFTAGVYMTSAVVSTLTGRLNAIMIPAISYIFYEDERRIVKNKNFLRGSFMALLGVAGVILGRNSVEMNGFNIGAVFVIMAAITWSVYAVYIKKLVKTIDPFTIVVFVSLLSTFFFLPVVLVFGNIHRITQVSTGTRALLFISGVVGVSGSIFYYHAIRRIGTSITSIFFLLLPLSVGVIAFLTLGETLTMIQIISGVVLMLGCWIVTRLVRKPDSQFTKNDEF